MPAENPNEQERKWDSMEREVVYLLTDPDRHPTIWSVPDIGRKMHYFDPESVVSPLCGVGLLHQTTDGFVFATPAAHRMVALVGHVV
jgi:hypothetical protein